MFYLYDSENGKYIGTSAEPGDNRTKFTPPSLDNNSFWTGETWEHRLSLPRVYSVIDFKLRFKFDELGALIVSDNFHVKTFIKILDDPRTTVVDCNLPFVQSAIRYLESIGIISIGRADEIIG